MAKRKIIKIDESKCDGCGLCIPNCPEGAIQVIDGKARLVSDTSCDGLGACLGHCPKEAITIEEREAKEYDEREVMVNIAKAGRNVIGAHLAHLKDHGQEKYLKEAIAFLKEKRIEIPSGFQQVPHHHEHGFSGCPGSRVLDMRGEKRDEIRDDKGRKEGDKGSARRRQSELRQWPVQITLISPLAPYFKDADILIAADCVPFAYASFHEDLLKGKILLVGCPKLDDIESYSEKIAQIVKNNNIKSITYAHMEVPCCFGLVGVIEEAISSSGKKTPFKEVVIGIKGEKLK